MFSTVLSSEFTKGRYIAPLSDNKIGLSSNPVKWAFNPTTFHNYSVAPTTGSEGLYMCASADSLAVNLEPYKSNNCQWMIGKNGELIASGAKMFTWVADDNMKLIGDGFVAEKWTELQGRSQSHIPTAVYLAALGVGIGAILYNISS